MTTVETGSLAPPAWMVCPGCEAMVYSKRFERGSRVCPECGRHGPLTADQRIELLLDPDTVEEIPYAATVHDPLDFHDSRSYSDRHADARRKTGMPDAVRCVRGEIAGNPAVMAVMDFRFLGGSLGSAVGEAVTTAAEEALRTRTPLIIVTASGGARMQEGVVALMQMAKTSQALGQLDEAGILTISVITDPTFGGVAASFATSTDIIVAEPAARLGFAGPRVIEQTIGEVLPPGFQTAEYLLEHGIVDLICPRDALRDTLSELVLIAGRRSRPRLPEVAEGSTALVTDPLQLPVRDPWACVRAARNLGRPTTLDYISLMFDDFVELHGDRMSQDCPALIGGIGRLDGLPVVVVGTQKGHTGDELFRRNYGMPTPAGYRKAGRMLRLAAKLGIPVIALVDTAGAFPGLEAEQQGQSVAIAESLKLLAGLPVPIVSVITGEGGSGGALALAFADRVLMCADAVYSVISPEGCAAILWKDPGAAPAAAAALRVDSRSLLELGVVDGVIPEPEGGAHGDHLAAADNLHRALTEALGEIVPLDQMSLVTQRRKRFRAFGTTHDEESR